MIMMSLLAHSSLQHWSIIRSCRSSIPISSLLPLYQRNYVSLLLPEVASSSSISNIAIVQGASRGIGLEFCRQLLAKRYSCKQNTNEEVDFENPVYRVYATCRNKERATELRQLFKDNGLSDDVIVEMDLCSDVSIERAGKELREKIADRPINLLINVSGILHNEELNMFPEKQYSDISSSAMELSYRTHVVGPALFMKELVPSMSMNNSKEDLKSGSVIANVSARVGSIADNRLGGWYSYRCSKAGLNMLTKNISIEMGRKMKKFACIALHPGTTKTDLSAPFQKNVKPEKLFPVEKSVSHMLDIIERVDEAGNGKFFAWDGEEIEW